MRFSTSASLTTIGLYCLSAVAGLPQPLVDADHPLADCPVLSSKPIAEKARDV